MSLLQQDALTAARLTDALQTVHAVQVCTSWSALEHRLGRREVDVCVIDADHPTREEAVARLTTLQQRHPTTALVAFGDFQGQEHTVYHLGRLGIDGVVTAQRGTESGHVRSAVEQALRAARARQAAALLEDRMAETGVRAVAWSMEHARERPSVDDLAEAMGQRASTFAATLREEGLPPPSRLLVWGRLLLAGALLARDGRTVEESAYRVGYAGASGLARAMKREVGRTPGQIARGGGMVEVHRELFPPGRSGSARGLLRLMVLLLAWVVQAGCATGGPGTPEAEPVTRIEAILGQPPLDGLHVGLLAVEARSGRTVLARNAHKRFIPASNQKVLTTAAALQLLGPDHRWQTTLWSAAPLVEGTLRGDLVLVGTGDPTLSRRYWPATRDAVEALADSLRHAGVERVDGRLVVDVSAWDSVSVPGSWEVGDLPFRWGATGGAFAVGEGEIHAVVRGEARAGRPAELVAWWPAGDTTFLRAELRTAPADSSTRVRGHHLPGAGALVLRGHVPAGVVDTVRLAVREPVRQAAALLRRTLVEEGVAIAGPTAMVWTREDAQSDSVLHCLEPFPRCPGARPLASLDSPPLMEVARGILEPSQNWMAEQLLRTLGHARSGEGSRTAGRHALTAYLVDVVGLDSLEAAPEDGSGLAPRNLLTPRALVAVLDQVRRSEHGEAYREALASPGEEDSTLENRLLDLRGRLFAKTGSISNVDALSGYLVRADGTELIFSVLSNGSGLPASTVRGALDAVVRILAEG